MWEQWNNVLHKSNHNREAILEKDINNKIRQMYAIGPGQLAQLDIGLMWHLLKHHLGHSLHTKQQWLESIVVALHRKQLHEYGAMTTEQRLMEMWVI